MCRELAETVSELWRTIGHAFDGYRPELHYMRGPGPKWRSKQSGIVTARTAIGIAFFFRPREKKYSRERVAKWDEMTYFVTSCSTRINIHRRRDRTVRGTIVF